jgi:hypothetical protein
MCDQLVSLRRCAYADTYAYAERDANTNADAYSNANTDSYTAAHAPSAI